MAGMAELLAQATQVTATLRRGNAEFQVAPMVDRETLYVALSEDQTSSLAAGGKGGCR